MISFLTGKLRRKKKLFWTNKKFVFFFNCSSWEKIRGNKIRGLVVWCHKQDNELTRLTKLWREKRVWKWLTKLEVPLTKTYFYLESVQPLSKIFEFQTNHWKRNENFSCKRDEQKCRTFDKLQKNARYQKLLKNSLGLLCKIEKEHLVRDIEIFIYLLFFWIEII